MFIVLLPEKERARERVREGKRERVREGEKEREMPASQCGVAITDGLIIYEGCGRSTTRR